MDNIITLPKWERYCKELCKKDSNYILVNISLLDINKYQDYLI